jgi:hypothetical protein
MIHTLPPEVAQAAQTLWDLSSKDLDEAVDALVQDMKSGNFPDDQTLFAFTITHEAVTPPGADPKMTGCYLMAIFRLARQRIDAEHE